MSQVRLLVGVVAAVVFVNPTQNSCCCEGDGNEYDPPVDSQTYNNDGASNTDEEGPP